MLRRGALSLSILLALSGLARAGEGPAPVGSAEPGGSSFAEIGALEAQIERDLAALSTDACAVACQALGSMRRSVERLCELDQGPRCASAQGKVRDAEARVRSRCPECAVAGGGVQPIAVRDKSAPPAPPPAAPSSQVDAQVVRGGGCAGCALSSDGDEGAGLLALVAALGLAAARRRGRRGAPRA